MIKTKLLTDYLGDLREEILQSFRLNDRARYLSDGFKLTRAPFDLNILICEGVLFHALHIKNAEQLITAPKKWKRYFRACFWKVWVIEIKCVGSSI